MHRQMLFGLMGWFFSFAAGRKRCLTLLDACHQLAKFAEDRVEYTLALGVHVGGRGQRGLRHGRAITHVIRAQTPCTTVTRPLPPPQRSHRVSRVSRVSFPPGRSHETRPVSHSFIHFRGRRRQTHATQIFGRPRHRRRPAPRRHRAAARRAVLTPFQPANPLPLYLEFSFEGFQASQFTCLSRQR